MGHDCGYYYGIPKRWKRWRYPGVPIPHRLKHIYRNMP
jgi:hypothetical protein